jgi:hypothetical protein
VSLRGLTNLRRLDLTGCAGSPTRPSMGSGRLSSIPTGYSRSHAERHGRRGNNEAGLPPGLVQEYTLTVRR